jgi:hypothetical protein
MSWTTIYIKGTKGFEPEVLRHLEKSGFSFLPGSNMDNGFSLYWINDRSQLREFKKAISAKTIFKYRLRFYTDMVAGQEEDRTMAILTANEKEMVKKMSEWQQAYNSELRHSA